MEYPSERYFIKSSGFNLNFLDGRFTKKEHVEISGSAIRVIKNNRIGFAYCTTKTECYELEKKAVENTKFGQKANFSFAPTFKQLPIKTVDKKLERISEDSIIDSIKSAHSYARSKRVYVDIYTSISTSFVHIENSRGLDNAYRKTHMEVYVDTKHSGHSFSVYNAGIEYMDIESITNKAVDGVLLHKDAKRLDSSSYNVVFTQRALLSFLDILAFHLSLKSVRTKSSILSGFLNKRFFSKHLTLIDSGIKKGANIRPFDDEGVPSLDRTIVNEGYVKTYLGTMEETSLYHKYSNNADNQEDFSGFCSRASFAQRPGSAFSNVYIKKGDSDFLDIYDKYVVVDNIHGMHTANVSTGDFGVSVITGWIEKDDEIIPLKPFSISGNIFDIFKDAVPDKKLETISYLTSPRILTKSVKIAI